MNKRSRVLFFCFWLTFLGAFHALSCRFATAAPVDKTRAQNFVKGWLKADSKPLGCDINAVVRRVETFTDDLGQPIYYVLYLQPNGFVITPAEDLVEPVVCFSSGGIFDPCENNPLGAMVSRDLPGRVSVARAVHKKTQIGQPAAMLTNQENVIKESSQKALKKWDRLLKDDGSSGILGYVNISDMWVEPLLDTKWGQTTVCGYACYNYYTPPYSEGSASNYPCGCVATAMAQYMRFWQHPSAGVGTPCFTISIDDDPPNPPRQETRCLRGGDGAGGAYNWDLMALEPDCGTTLAQRQAIATLMHDAGAAVEMEYASDGSGAYMSDADAAMVYPFGYSNSIRGFNNNDNIPSAALNNMVNPNLDSGNPVILGVLGGSPPNYYGHAIVADGYGYNGSTLYHHLNLGWDGTSDAWYNLPNIDSSPYSFNVVDAALYNIYVTGSGEIISGRVTESVSGAPVSGVTVTATRTGGGSYQDTTDANGIFAIAKVPSNSTYNFTVTKTDYIFSGPSSTSTGRSRDGRSTTGNVWAINFQGTFLSPSPPVAMDLNVSAQPGESIPIILPAADDGRPNPPAALDYIITSLPAYGDLSDPGAGVIDAVPYAIVNYGNTVYYASYPCFIGSDDFQFRANDGGEPPDGGDSNVATVSVTVQSLSEPQVIYQTYFDAGLPAGWTIAHDGSTSQTWKSASSLPIGSSSFLTAPFMLADSSTIQGYMDEKLISHNIDCTGLSDVKLRFTHRFEWWSSGANEIGDVDVSVNGGAWQNAARYQGANFEGQVELDLSACGADDAAQVQVRWRYYNTDWEWYWAVDNIEIIGSPAAQTMLPGDFEGDCDVDYDDLAHLAFVWLAGPADENWNPYCDIAQPPDAVINLLDYAVFAQNWLTLY